MHFAVLSQLAAETMLLRDICIFLDVPNLPGRFLVGPTKISNSNTDSSEELREAVAGKRNLGHGTFSGAGAMPPLLEMSMEGYGYLFLLMATLCPRQAANST
mmetsp:Transcript_22880/g.53971  ORF Transcript_22880/g.53971 Transcript_22880/m.53971 type:complete len:102 (-) Transcript_22880:2-307(-)